MIRVTVELVSAIHPDRSRVLGTMEICNDGEGTKAVGNYAGVLHAEYTGAAGRTAKVKGYKREKQSVWTLIGAFLKKWNHTTIVEPKPEKDEDWL